MSLSKRLNKKASTIQDTGFGVNSSAYGSRFLNRDGSANVLKKGIGFFEKISWYHVLLKMSTKKFVFILFSIYILINIFFACCYLLAGFENLTGTTSIVWWKKLEDAFFFSCQTFTTVGYGGIQPSGTIANVISSIETFTGWLGFALAAGLMYGRFSQPKAYLKFTTHAVIAPYKEGKALMFRLAPHKNTILSNAQAKLTLGLTVEEDGRSFNRFFPMDLYQCE